MLDAIKQWLNNPADYGAGAALYFMHGDNEMLKALFLKGYSALNKTQLIKQLSIIYDRNSPTSIRSTPPQDAVNTKRAPLTQSNIPDKLPHAADEKKSLKNNTPEPSISTALPVNIDPELLLLTDTAAKNAWKEMMNKRAVLFSMCRGDDWQHENMPDRVTQRGKLALEILQDNKTKVTPAYNKLHDLKTTGRINHDAYDMADQELVPDAQLKHTIDNLRKALNKNKKKEQTPERLERIQEQEILLAALLKRWELIK